jgi:hypothetical protein
MYIVKIIFAGLGPPHQISLPIFAVSLWSSMVVRYAVQQSGDVGIIVLSSIVQAMVEYSARRSALHQVYWQSRLCCAKPSRITEKMQTAASLERRAENIITAMQSEIIAIVVATATVAIMFEPYSSMRLMFDFGQFPKPGESVDIGILLLIMFIQLFLELIIDVICVVMEEHVLSIPIRRQFGQRLRCTPIWLAAGAWWALSAFLATCIRGTNAELGQDPLCLNNMWSTPEWRNSTVGPPVKNLCGYCSEADMRPEFHFMCTGRQQAPSVKIHLGLVVPGPAGD